MKKHLKYIFIRIVFVQIVLTMDAPKSLEEGIVLCVLNKHETKEYLGEYTNERFHLVCKNNPQYRKIAYNEYNSDSDDGSVDDMYWYDDRNIWLE